MECSICMEAIAPGTNTSTTECGHTFHFQCLYRWNRKHTNCPMCRKDFGRFDDEEEYCQLIARTVLFDTLHRVAVDEPMQRRRRLREEAAAMYQAIPIEEFAGIEIESRDVDLVLRHTEGISRESAKSYLRHFGGDIVETIMFLVYHKRMPIPEFRERERPPLAEPYVSPIVVDRIVQSRRVEARRGYESS